MSISSHFILYRLTKHSFSTTTKLRLSTNSVSNPNSVSNLDIRPVNSNVDWLLTQLKRIPLETETISHSTSVPPTKRLDFDRVRKRIHRPPIFSDGNISREDLLDALTNFEPKKTYSHYKQMYK